VEDPFQITAEIDANLEHGRKIWSVVQSLWRHMQLREREAEATRAARALLGIGSPGEVAYRHSSTHSDFTPGKFHPDNTDALSAAADLDIVRAGRDGRLRLLDRSGVVDVEKSMVLIGSPVAEALSRDLFGYQPAEGLDNGLRLTQSPVDLPFRWQLDPEGIDPGATATRFVRGHGPAARPNWRIVSERDGRLFIPAVDNDGWLRTDYLLVTRLRNFITRAAWQRGSFVVSFGGAHGTGTRAVDLLLRDEQLLRQIAERLGESPVAYQLLLEVGQMTHHPKEGTRAHAIRLVAAERIEDNEERWEEANRVAFPGFKGWLRGNEGLNDEGSE
jgi:hypothetical protein